MKQLIRLISITLCIVLSACGTETAEADPASGITAENPYMNEAIQEAWEGMMDHHGGPFGAVVVKDGEIVGRGHNRVYEMQDPTCHAEIMAIQDACRNLGTLDLSGCGLYTTCEPCAMCLYASRWANIETVYYGCTIEDKEEIGFGSEAFSKLQDGREAMKEYLIETDHDACLELFSLYQAADSKRD
ncbi:MAG: nucleoside deaminase [Solobacterium sp.]|nr:nucleoside deaminase [Solobacterium sp.]